MAKWDDGQQPPNFSLTPKYKKKKKLDSLQLKTHFTNHLVK